LKNTSQSDLILFTTPNSSTLTDSNENLPLVKKDDTNNNSNNNNNKENSNQPKLSSNKNRIKIMNAINYRGNTIFHKEYYATILCFKETYSIEELHLYFDDALSKIPSQGFNFRIQIYTIGNSKIYDLKSTKYYYDHTWKLVTKTTGKTKSSLKNKDLKDKYYINDEDGQIEESVSSDLKNKVLYEFDNNNVLKINFKRWNNEFNAHYLFYEISINDGTKEMNPIPNLMIFPVIIGKKSLEEIPGVEQFDKFYNSLILLRKKLSIKFKK
jgi:hypothetical protein